MLKRLLSVTLALMLVLGLSGLALATGNSLTLEQHGDSNIVLAYQSSDNDNTATIGQDFDALGGHAYENFVGLVQVCGHGMDNTASIIQYAWVNDTWVVQIDEGATYIDFAEPEDWADFMYCNGPPDWSKWCWYTPLEYNPTP